MNIPYIPTPEELARYQLPTQTQSTGMPATPMGLYAPPPPQPRPPLAQCVLTAAQLSRLKIPRRPALLDRWLREGDLGYIFAPRGVGKTWMAMALPGAISRRRPLGLWQAGDPAPPPSSSSATASSELPDTSADTSTATATANANDTTTAAAAAPDLDFDLDLDLDPPACPDHVPVLYIDGEMALDLTQYRSNGLQLALGNVNYLHHEHQFNTHGACLNIGEHEDRQRISALLQQGGYKVLILDNLSSLASGIDENKGTDYEPLSHWLLDLRRRHITVIVIHHAGRSGLMRGHTKREDACSWIIELRDARQDGETGAKFVSHFAKPSRNTGEPLPDLLWHFTSDAEGITDIKCEIAINSEYDQFIQHVIEGVTNQHDLAEMMNKNRGTISKWATKALQDGLIGGTPRKLLPPKSHPDKVQARAYADDEDD